MIELEELVDRFGPAEGVRLTAHVTDTYVATEISKFDNAEIPDMSASQRESLHWISKYILNSVLRGALPSPQREYRFNFLRRAMTACNEHFLARHATLAFLEHEERSFGKYFTAIHHWEQMPPQGSLAVWLCNFGLRSIDSELTFAETGELLAKIGDWAHVAEDPLQGRPYDWARAD